MRKTTVLLALASLLAPVLLTAQGRAKDVLLALSKRDGTLSVVDPSSLKVLARVPVGKDPHEVVASADGKTAYVSNYGGGAYNTLSVVDLGKQTALPPVDLGPLRGPHGLAFEAGKTWFTAEAAKAIGSYDPTSGKVDWVLGTGQNRTHMIFVAKDAKWIVTTNVGSGTVTIIEKGVARPEGPPPPMPHDPTGPPNPPSGMQGGPMGPPPGDAWEETVVPVGLGAEGFDVSPDGTEIWVANAQDGTISIVDVASKKVATLAASARGANRLKFTPDGKKVLVSSLGDSGLIVLDTRFRQEVKRIRLGRGAAGIVMQPDGTRAYVACSPDNYVAVIDLQSLQVVGRIDVGPEPDGLAWATMR